VNQTRGTILADRADIANTPETRNTGLLKHSSLEPGEGLWIVPCQSIHMFFMKFSIDVVFLSKEKKVLKIRPDLGKWRIAISLFARSVLELPVGTLAATKTVPGDQLEFEKYGE
jgi:uncharacterized membrane protein (UPF0127 family)